MFTPKLNAAGQYQIYLAGQWQDAAASEFLPNVVPAHTSQVLGQVAECPDAEVNAAVEAAETAFSAWRAVSGNMKTKIFLHLAQVMYARFADFQQTMSREMGKTLFDCKLDLDEAIGVVECVAPQGLSLKGETYAKNIDGVVMESRLEPRGVAAIITPFNFPVAIPIAQVVSALVTGNTVVWKPSHLIPESSQAVAAALDGASVVVLAAGRRVLPLGQRNAGRHRAPRHVQPGLRRCRAGAGTHPAPAGQVPVVHRQQGRR